MAIRTLTGTLTIPSTEPSTNGFYDDVFLRLFLVENGGEELIDAVSIPTTNIYEFTFDDQDKQSLIKIVRASTQVVMSATTTRGVLPRSFLIPNTDPEYYTDTKTSNYTYDAGLAILAASGGRFFSLAKEITGGILAADQAGKIPFKVNHIAPAGNGVTPAPDLFFKTGTIATVAYSLGFYLEKNPYATNVAQVGQYLYKLLQHLAVNQNIGLHGGLVTAGQGAYYNSTFNPAPVDYRALTPDNILAYLAFKQAGRVLHSAYLQAASDLYDVIMDKLWVSGTTCFMGGRQEDGASITDNLEANFLGVYMLKEEGEVIKANQLLARIEANYSAIDPVTQAIGYKATTGSTEVWMEGSYAVAIAYRKMGNSTKYAKILKDLNKFLQADGSFQYGIIKDGQYQVKSWESVGSTAWSYMANRFPLDVFSTRDTASITSGIGNYYVNARHEDEFFNTCPSGYTPTPFLFWVPVGYYYSTVSQSLVDQNAFDRVLDNGQTFANNYGLCQQDPIYFNTEQSDFFQKNDCGSGLQGTMVQYTILGGTFGSTISQQDADDQALAALDSGGQAYANANGSCMAIIDDVTISIVLSSVDNGTDDLLYVTAYATHTLETSINIEFDYGISPGVAGFGTATISPGSTNSYSQYVATVPSGEGDFYSATITAVDPTSYGNQTYSF
ncbi:DUF5977 domain-containing protein [Flaviaesturariibacter amylovorans]|uniref:DUF5977 domain-containing protein n=1 Tax=Flaviaesturariibacter amylovorans TaxID=1084520 RepID=A0ABP8GLD4_9BACT